MPKRNVARSAASPTARTAELELRPDRAFVLQLDVRAHLPRRMVGRVEHVTSGQVTHVTSVGELVAFLAKVLRSRIRNERGNACADLAEEPDELAPIPRASRAEDAAASAAPSTRQRTVTSVSATRKPK